MAMYHQLAMRRPLDVRAGGVLLLLLLLLGGSDR